ncbi:hypothetical protein F4808DRAFT_463615 [Astrocystis sublimbata]|nr:hypothetical protein F4808DRAFT_463615 [Astrocystis sublimbata]
MPVPSSSSTTTQNTTPISQPNRTETALNGGTIAGIAIGSFIALLAATMSVFLILRRRKKEPAILPDNHGVHYQPRMSTIPQEIYTPAVLQEVAGSPQPIAELASNSITSVKGH